jgi:hypothetical protein
MVAAPDRLTSAIAAIAALQPVVVDEEEKIFSY